MATYDKSTSEKYSDGLYAAGDIIRITNRATFTIDTDTVSLASLEVLSGNKGGTLLLQNTSTTTPIFIKINTQISASNSEDCLFRADGRLIQIGTGDGTTKTYTLPQNAAGENYGNLGGLWVDRGDTFRDGEAYYRTYGQVVDASLLVSLDYVSDVFSQNTTANTVTFHTAPPAGAAIYVPNIQVKVGATPAASPLIQAVTAARADLSCISFSSGFRYSFSQSSSVRFRYVACGEDIVSSLSLQSMAGLLDLRHAAVRVESLRIDGAPEELTLRNICIVGRNITSVKFVLSTCVGAYLERVRVLLDTEVAATNGSGLVTITGINSLRMYDMLWAGHSANGLSVSQTPRIEAGNITSAAQARQVVTSGGFNALTMLSLSNSSNVRIAGITQLATTLTYDSSHISIGAGSSDITLEDVQPLLSSLTNNFVVNSGTRVRINGVVLRSLDGTLPGKVLTANRGSDGLALTNWQVHPSLTARYNSRSAIYEYRANASFDRIPILSDRRFIASSFGGLPQGFSGDNSTSMHYTESATRGVLATPFAALATLKPNYFSASGDFFVDATGRLYLTTLGSSATIQTDEHSGITGVAMVGMIGQQGFTTTDFADFYLSALQQAGSSTLAGDGLDHKDIYDTIKAYSYSVETAVRRPGGTWSGWVRGLGQAIKGTFTPSNFYQVGDTITQLRADGVTITGTVIDIVRSNSSTTEAVLIGSMTASDGSLKGYSVTETLDGTNSTITNARNNYRPTVASLTASTAQFPDPTAWAALDAIVAALPEDAEDTLQFRHRVERVPETAAEETGAVSDAKYLQNLYIDTKIRDYTVPFQSVPVAISGTNIADGSRVQLYNLTTGAELANFALNPDSPAGEITTGFERIFDLGSATISEGDVVRLRATCQTGETALLPLEEIGVVTTAGLVFPQAQEPDTIYNSNGIDGAAITGIALTPDYASVQIDLDDDTPPYEITAQEIYNFYAYLITTAPGVANFYGAITPIDRLNYRINASVVPLKIQNTGSTDVVLSGGRLYRDDNVSVIDTGAGSGTGSLMQDTGQLIQYLQPQVDAAIANYGVATAAGLAATEAALKKKITQSALL